MTKYVNDGHILYWVIEDGEVAEHSVEHPESCDRKCNIAHEEEYQPLDEDTCSGDCPIWKEREDGAYKVDIEYYYSYSPPCYPDWEHDSEFGWRTSSKVRKVY